MMHPATRHSGLFLAQTFLHDDPRQCVLEIRLGDVRTVSLSVLLHILVELHIPRPDMVVIQKAKVSGSQTFSTAL